MAFGDTIFPDNVGTPVSIDQAFPSYAAILKTGSKQTWSQVIAAAAVTAECHWVYVEITKTNISATDSSAVLDIGVDPAGGTSYAVVIADLLVGHVDDHNANNGSGGCLSYAIPLRIASGSSVAIRGQTVTGADKSASVRVSLLGGASGTPYSGGTCSTYGVTGTGGTVITPGSDATWSSWVSIGSVTALNLQAVCLGVQPLAGTSTNRQSYQVQIGVSSAAISTIYDFHVGAFENLTGPRPALPAYVFIASGAQLQARARASSGGTIDNIRVALYGVSAT